MLEWPSIPNVRIDTGIVTGSVVHPFYDPMLAKVIAWSQTRDAARQKLVNALESTTLLGLNTNQHYLIQILKSDFYQSGQTFTTTLESQSWLRPQIPDYVRAAVLPLLSGRRPVADGDHAPNDRYSPWQSLGQFRMGR